MKTGIVLGCLLAVQILFAQTNVKRGGVDGGGGKGVACYNDQGVMTSLEVLDLYEARLLYGLKLEAPQGSVREILEQIQDKFLSGMPVLETYYRMDFARVQKIIRFLPPDVGLKPVDDAAEVLLPEKCKLVQLANYVDDELLLISEEYWNQLDVINQAALLTHEAVYKYERSFGAKNSRRARKVVGHLFSNFRFEPTHEATNGQDMCTVKLGNKQVAAFTQKKDRKGKTLIRFIIYDNKPVYSNKWAILPFEFSTVEMPKECGPTDYCGFAPIPLQSNFESADEIMLIVKLVEKNGVVGVRTYFAAKQGELLVTCNDY